MHDPFDPQNGVLLNLYDEYKINYNDKTVRNVSVDTAELKRKLEKIIIAYCARHSSNHKQGGYMWKKGRSRSVGGSEIAKIVGVSPYGGTVDIIRSKVGIGGFKGSMYTRWGNLIESVIEMFTEYDLNTTIYATDIGSIKGHVEYSTYSPDGLAVVDIPYIYENIDESGNVYRNVVKIPEIVLLEFKCPFSRIPTKSIPKYYVPQIKTGMNIIPFVKKALFIQAVFRRCAYMDLGDNPAYDTTLHTKSDGKYPLAYGIVGLYFATDEEISRYYSGMLSPEESKSLTGKCPSELIKYKTSMMRIISKYKLDLGDNLDLGSVTKKEFDQILEAYEKRILLPYYPEIIPKNSNKTVESITYKFEKFCKHSHHNAFGVLPWKLFRVDYNWEDETPGYIDELAPQLAEVINTVNTILDDPKNIDSHLHAHLVRMGKKPEPMFDDD